MVGLLFLYFHMVAVLGVPEDVFVAGRVFSVEGEPLSSGKVSYYRSWCKEDRRLQSVPIDDQGRFFIPFGDSDRYMIVFSVPGYQPLGLYVNTALSPDAQIRVTLDRYPKPEGHTPLLIHEADGFNEADPTPMTRQGDTWSARIPWQGKTLRYQIKSGRYRVMGPDPAAGIDERFNYFSRVPVIDGFAEIRIRDGEIPFRTQPYGADIGNLENGEALVAETKFHGEYEKYRELIIEKLSKNDHGETGLEPLFEVLEQMLATVANPDQKLLLSAQWHYRLCQFTQAFNVDHELSRRLENQPSFLARLDVTAAISFLEQSLAQHKDPGIAYKTYLSYRLNDESRLNAMSRLRQVYVSAGREPLAGFWATELLHRYPNSYQAYALARESGFEGMVGRLAPDFQLSDGLGGTVSLSQFRGKWVVLNFWASWCPPCIVGMPEYRVVVAELSSENVLFLSVCIDKDGEDLGRLIEKYDLNWPQAGTTGNWEAPVVQAFNVPYVPRKLLITPNGKISRHDIGGKKGEELAFFLEKITKQGEFIGGAPNDGRTYAD